MMDLMHQAKRILLEPAGLSEPQLEQLLNQVLSKQIDSADFYFQARESESWLLEDSLVKEGSFNIERGVGVRAISGDKTGFAYADEILPTVLKQASLAARSIAMGGKGGQMKMAAPIACVPRYSQCNPLLSLSEPDKIALLHAVDQKARSLDARIQQVIASLVGVYEVVYILASDGTVGADVRPLVRLNVQVVAEYQGRREIGGSGGGLRGDYQYFLNNNQYETYVAEAVQQACVNLIATETPAGTMPVVLGPGWPGILLHEAIGHGLEGDFNRKGTSAFSGRLGELIANPACTIVDDGTLPHRRGSLTIDDEGTPGQYTVLIKDGILQNYMQDKLNAKLMNMQATGNGRRESYAHLPLPRMTNTYMLPGQYDPQEIIASVSKGLYAANFDGGQVDITSGKFVFSASQAYLIENGKITQPVKGATLIGDGPNILPKISMVGNDLTWDSGVGTCGKEGQSVPVGVGQPTLKVDALTVGGTLVS